MNKTTDLIEKSKLFPMLEKQARDILAYQTDSRLFLGSVVAMRKTLEAIGCYLLTYCTHTGKPVVLSSVVELFHGNGETFNATIPGKVKFGRNGADDPSPMLSIKTGISTFLHYQAYRYQKRNAQFPCDSLDAAEKFLFIEHFTAFDATFVSRFGQLLQTFLIGVGEDPEMVHEFNQLQIKYPMLHHLANHLPTEDEHLTRQNQFITTLNSAQTPTWIAYACDILYKFSSQSEDIKKNTTSAINRIIAEKAGANYLLTHGVTNLHDRKYATLETYDTDIRHLKKPSNPEDLAHRTYILDKLRIIADSTNLQVHFDGYHPQSPNPQKSKPRKIDLISFEHAASSSLVNDLNISDAPEPVQRWINRRPDELKALQEALKQSRRQVLIRNIIIAVLSVIFLIVVGFFTAHQLNQVEHPAAFGDYVWRNGAPVGIFPLTDEEVATRSEYYTLTTRGGQVIRIEHCNALGQVSDENNQVRTSRPARAELQYAKSGEVDSILFFDAEGEGIYAWDYAPDLTSIDLKDANTLSTSFYLPGSVVDMDVRQWNDLSNSTAIQGEFSSIDSLAIKSRDEQGRVQHVVFQRGDETFADQNGITGLKYTYDSIGRVTSIRYLYSAISSADDAQANRLTEQRIDYDMEYVERFEEIYSDGTVKSKTYAYNPVSHTVNEVRFGDSSGALDTNPNSVVYARYRYDQQSGQVTHIGYYNRDDEPVLGQEGYAAVSLQYQNGLLTEQSYLNTEGNLMAGPSTWARKSILREDNGNKITTTFWNASNRRMELSSGYATEILINSGNTQTQLQYDASGKPVAFSAGVYQKRLTRNDDHLITLVEYLDQNGQPALHEGGYASMRYEYNRQGRKASESFYGLDGKPVNPTNSYTAKQSYEYNAKGQITQVTFSDYDEKHEKYVLAKGVAYKIQRFDSQGRWILLEYRDADEKYINIKNGYAYGKREYLANGTETQVIESYWRADGSRAFHKSYNYSYVISHYDQKGRETHWTYYGTDEKPILHATRGYASVEYTYDNQDHVLTTTYYDVDTQPFINPVKGYAALQNTYEGNKIVRQTYFDAEHKPMITSKGYATLYQEFDANGNKTLTAYLDEKDELINHPEKGFAAIKSEYDEYGNEIYWAYYDANKKPIIHSEYGYAAIRRQFDDHGNAIYWEFYNEKGEPFVNPKYGYAAISREFDEDNNEVYWAYFDEKDKPIVHAEYGFAAIRKEYNSDGKEAYWAYYDDQGQPITPEDKNAPIYRKEYGTTETGTWQIERTFDANDQPFMTDKRYAARYWEFDQNGNTVVFCFYDLNDKPVISPEYGYATVKSEYDVNGNEVFWAYFDENDEPMIHPEYGYASVRNEYDADGNKVAWTYFDVNGEPMIHSEYGYASLRRKFDANGNVIYRAYFDVNSEPMIHPEYGYASIKREYDADGNEVYWAYFDEKGEPMIHEEYGYAAIRREFDANGNESAWTYFNAQGEVFINPEVGYASTRVVYDEAGHLLSEHFYNEKGELFIPDDFDYAVVRYEYDANGNTTCTSYYNEKDELCRFGDEDYAMVYAEYDEYGNLICEYYYNEQGNLLTSAEDSTAVVRAEYDEAGRVVGYSCYNEKDELLADPRSGCATVRYEYDTAGNEVSRSYYNEKNQLTINDDFGYAIVRHEYDANGRKTGWSYYNANNKLYMHPEYGYASTRIEYDADGNQVSQIYFNETGEPIGDPFKKTSTTHYKYDKNGNVASISFFNAKGELVINPEYGYATVRNEYDESGNQVGWRYFNEKDEPFVHPEYGYARIQQLVSASGKLTYCAYYGADNELIIHPEKGYAAIRQEYDENDNLTYWAYYNEKGELFIHPASGHAIVRQEHDQNGNLVLCSYYNEKDELFIHPEHGYATIRYEYDQQGRVVKEAYFNAEQQPVFAGDAWCAAIRWQYDAQGNKTYWGYFDLADQPMMSEFGYASTTLSYQGDELVEQLYFDEKGNKLFE